jgi:hypothetical protein
MINYYKVLGVKQNAGSAEIKLSFRKLAVIYHPDKNPGDSSSQENFLKIKEAYDVLIDPIKRQKYDSSLRYRQSYNQQSTKKHGPRKTRKDYTFTENQYQQRQEFAKKFRQSRPSNQDPPTEVTTSYNDFKYIMISVPLAIAILFLVINVLSRDFSHEYHSQPTASTGTNTKSLSKNTTDKSDLLSPTPEVSIAWDSIFCTAISDSSFGGVLHIENRSGHDVVFYLKNIRNKKVIRSKYLFNNYYFDVKFIPKGNYQLWAIYGEDWYTNFLSTESKKYGNFNKIFAYALLNPDTFISFKKPKDSLIIKLPAIEKLNLKNLKNIKDFFAN